MRPGRGLGVAVGRTGVAVGWAGRGVGEAAGWLLAVGVAVGLAVVVGVAVGAAVGFPVGVGVTVAAASTREAKLHPDRAQRSRTKASTVPSTRRPEFGYWPRLKGAAISK